MHFRSRWGHRASWQRVNDPDWSALKRCETERVAAVAEPQRRFEAPGEGACWRCRPTRGPGSLEKSRLARPATGGSGKPSRVVLLPRCGIRSLPTIMGDEWGTLPRSSLSTKFVLPVSTRARFPGRVSRSTGHASSIRTSLNRTRDKVDEPACFLWRLHELPDGAGSVVHISPRTRNAGPQARIGAQSALAVPGFLEIIRHAELLSPRAPK